MVSEAGPGGERKVPGGRNSRRQADATRGRGPGWDRGLHPAPAPRKVRGGEAQYAQDPVLAPPANANSGALVILSSPAVAGLVLERPGGREWHPLGLPLTHPVLGQGPPLALGPWERLELQTIEPWHPRKARGTWLTPAFISIGTAPKPCFPPKVWGRSFGDLGWGHCFQARARDGSGG